MTETKSTTKKSEDKSASSKLADSFNDATKSFSEESAKYLKGYSIAYMEGVRLASENYSNMMQEISDQIDTTEKESIPELLSKVPERLAKGASKALDGAAEIPSKVADKFKEAYPKDD